MNQADVSKLVSKLRYRVSPRHKNLRTIGGPQARLDKLRATVTALLQYERLELNFTRADEVRGYAERLIDEAMRHGDKHEPSMKLINYWVTKKEYVHKLFNVLVPRYRNCPLSYTQIFKAPKLYPYVNYGRSILELRGNPYPPFIFNNTRNRNLIHNVLLDEARKEYRRQKDDQILRQVSTYEEKMQQLDEERQQVEQISEDEELLKFKHMSLNEKPEITP